jgi:hypothetical protein
MNCLLLVAQQVRLSILNQQSIVNCLEHMMSGREEKSSEPHCCHNFPSGCEGDGTENCFQCDIQYFCLECYESHQCEVRDSQSFSTQNPEGSIYSLFATPTSQSHSGGQPSAGGNSKVDNSILTTESDEINLKKARDIFKKFKKIKD